MMKAFFYMAALTMLLFSCQKEALHNTQPSQISPISFKTMEDAKEYMDAFKPKGRVHRGNIHDRKSFVVQPRLYELLERNEISYSQPRRAPAEEAPAETSVSLTDWFWWSGYNVSFSWHSNGTTITSFGNFNSALVGFHLGVSWTHVSGTAISRDGIIHFTIRGYQHYNIIVEGIGTLYTQPVAITGTYNTRTGSYTMKES